MRESCKSETRLIGFDRGQFPEEPLPTFEEHVEGMENMGYNARVGYAQYKAEAGFKSINADIGVMVPVTDHWSANAMVGYSQLVGDAADSPIVKDEGQLSGGIFVSYTF